MFGLRVGDVMTSGLVSVVGSTPLKDVARILYEGRVSGVPVLDGEGRAIGVISEGDLLRFEIDREERPERRSLVEVFLHPDRLARFHALAEGLVARDVMTPWVHSVTQDAPLPVVIRTIVHTHVRRLVVTDGDGRAVGIVTRHDLLAPLLRSDDDLAREVREEIIEWLPGGGVGHVRVGVDDGVVTLDGHVERQEIAQMAVRLTERVPGVTGVHDGLTWDRGEHLPRDVHVEPATSLVERTLRIN